MAPRSDGHGTHRYVLTSRAFGGASDQKIVSSGVLVLGGGVGTLAEGTLAEGTADGLGAVVGASGEASPRAESTGVAVALDVSARGGVDPSSGTSETATGTFDDVLGEALRDDPVDAGAVLEAVRFVEAPRV